MEAIKISVEVSVNLSENTQNFIKSMFTLACGYNQSVAQVASPVSAEIKSAPSAPAPSAPAPSAPAPSAVSSNAKTIEDVRKMLSIKVNEHRDVIKQKLNELGAPSVTKLDQSKYNEMYNFLESL